MSPIHWIIVIAVAVLLFGGRGKISGLMGDFAKGIKAFKTGMKEGEEEPAATMPQAQVIPPAAAAAAPAGAEHKRETV